MERKQVQSGRSRMPWSVLVDATEQAPKAANASMDDLTRILLKAKVSPSRREHLRRGDIKCAVHLREFLTGNPTVARELTDYIRGHFGATLPLSSTDRMSLFIAECDTQGREDALEARWIAGRADSAEKAELLALVQNHRDELAMLADVIAAELHAPTTGAGR